MRINKPVTLTFAPDLLERVDAFCAENGYSRSRFLSLAASDYLDTREKLPQIKNALSSYLEKTSALLRGEIDTFEWEEAANLTQLTIDSLKQQ